MNFKKNKNRTQIKHIGDSNQNKLILPMLLLNKLKLV